MKPFVIGIALCAALCAQDPFGRMTGRVRDSAGAVIPGAAVKIRNLETNVVAATVANGEGNWEAGSLNPGQYQLTVEAPGFKLYDRKPLELRLGDVLTLDATLEVGSITESVVVTAETPLLESANADLAQVVDHQRVQDLPLPAGNPMYLLQLTPGTVATTAPTHPWLPNAVDSVSGSAAAGTRSRFSEFTLDGIPNMTQGGQTSFVPPPEMIQEVRVRTAPFDASVGHFTGANVNMAMKSGTNALHGDLFYSHSGRPLMARTFFTNRAIYDPTTGPPTREKIDLFWPNTRLDHYRGSAGGPLIRNRTFWMFGLDQLYRLRNEPDYSTVPMAAQRQGDFSQLLALGAQYQIYDPATIQPAPAGRFSRQPFAGNRIPASRFDNVAKTILAYYPLPNVAGAADGRNNYYDPQQRSGPYMGLVGRVDHVFTQNNRFYATFSHSATDVKSGQAFPNEASGVLLDRRHNALALSDVVLLRPDLVLDVRAGATRYMHFQRPVSFGFDLGKLGMAPSLVSRLDRSITSFPDIGIDGLTALGRDSGQRNPTIYYSFAGTVSNVRSGHSLRAGADYRVLRENNSNYGNVAPSIDFSSTWTRGPMDNSAAAPIGQGLASFLLGLPTGGGIDINASYAQQSQYLAFFLQDDWKAAGRLTVNLGLRFETDFPVTERYNRATRGFDFATTNPIEPAARANYAQAPIAELPAADFRARGGLLFAGVNGQPRGLTDVRTNQFAPRLGLAWRARPDTVLRAGYGIFYESNGGDRINVRQQGFNQRTNLQPSLDNGMSFRATLANPFPDGWLQPAGASAGLATYVGRAPAFYWTRRRNGYMQRWTANVQRKIGPFVAEVGYLGNRGTHLGVNEDFNPVPRQYLSTSPVRDAAAINFLTQAVPNPFLNLPEFAGGGLQGRTLARSQLLKPLPQFSGLTSTLDGGLSWYHALTARAERRFARGYTLTAAYTFSKFMEAVDRLNPTDPRPEHVISETDRPHVLVMSGIYELPWLKRRRWIGGWSLQGVYQRQSGAPLNFGNILFYSDIHGIPTGGRNPDRWFNVDAGFERDSRRTLAQNIRSFPSRLSGVRADGYNNLNLSVFKTVYLREKLRLQLRCEAIDAPNRPIFAAPNTNPTNALFGKSDSVAGNQQRQVFLGAKLHF